MFATCLQVGSATCKKCGLSTMVTSDHTGCNLKDCSVAFTLENSRHVQYNLSVLQRFNYSMIEAKKDSNNNYRYFLNPCTTVHDNSSCAASGKPVPAMACQQACWTGYFCYSTYSLGDTIGFQKAQNALNGLTLQFTHGDSCYDGTPRKTVVHMICDQYAGVGQPERYGNNTSIEVTECQYVLQWRSTYACPVCIKEYFSAVYGKCRDNGKKELRFVKEQPCWSGYTPNNMTVNCYRDCTENDFQVFYSDCADNGTRLKSYVHHSPCQDGYIPPRPVAVKCSSSAGGSGDSKKVPVLVGVGVTVIVVLIVIVLFFYYRNRSLRYRYYTALGSARPMEKLGIVDDTEDEADTFHFSPGSDTDGDNPFSSDI